jgi:hypothetical protein
MTDRLGAAFAAGAAPEALGAIGAGCGADAQAVAAAQIAKRRKKYFFIFHLKK